ncbi:MAG: hypothetical protein ABW021_10665 [Acidimicrobiia bacterium]
MGTETMDRNRLKRLLPWGLTAIVVLLTLLLSVLLLIVDEETKAAAGFNSESAWGPVVLGVIPVFFAVLGAIIAAHQPGNPISWLFIAVGFAFLFEGLGWMVVVDHPEPPSFGDVLALAMVNSGFFIFSVAAFLVFYIFPTGRFLSRRWSWAGWLAAAVSAEVFLVQFFLEEVGLTEFLGQDWVTHNPFGVIPVGLWYDGPLQVFFGIGLITLFVGVIPAVIVRYLRSSGLVRAQIRWVAFAAGVWVVVFAINLFSPGEGDVFSTLNFIALAMVPVSVVVAITRFRLYDIDRIISRAIGYTVVVVFLSAVYTLGAVWIPTRLLGRQPPVFVAASTLIVVALFNRVRRPILAWIDRRFYRSHYNAEQVIDSFAKQLRNETDTARLTEQLLTAASETLQPATIGVWVHTEGDPSVRERHLQRSIRKESG